MTECHSFGNIFHMGQKEKLLSELLSEARHDKYIKFSHCDIYCRKFSKKNSKKRMFQKSLAGKTASDFCQMVG